MIRLGYAFMGLVATAAVGLSPSVQAATYNLSGMVDGSTVDLTFTTSDTLNAYGYDITGVSGSISGYGTVSTYTGTVPNKNDQVNSGLYVAPPSGPVPGGTVFTVQNPANSGGANFEVDNVWTTSDPYLTYTGGVAFLLSDGLTAYLSAASASNSAGQYYLFLGDYAINSNFTASVLETPLPGALPLFASGLGALGLLAWSKRRKPVAL